MCCTIGHFVLKMDDLVATFIDQTTQNPPPTVFSTGSLRLDIALGIGGIPGGTIVEISAPESGGKTTLAYHLIAEAQKSGGACAFIDSDRAFETAFARQCGVQIEQLYFSQPEHAEQAFDIIETLASSGAFALVALDSLNSLVSYHELTSPISQPIDRTEAETLEIEPELLARSLRRLSVMLHHIDTAIIFTSRTDRRMSTIYHQLAAHPARLALKLNASMHIRLIHLSNLICDGQVIGERFRVRVIKNKFAPCLQPIDFDIIHHQGIDKTGEVLDLGVHCKLIQPKNTGIYFREERLGRTASEAISFLNQNIIVRNDIEEAIRQLLIPDSHTAAT
jgi:recombination protein RecA